MSAPTLLKLFCSKCNKLVDAPPPRRALPRAAVTASCGDTIRVRLIPFSEAKEGVELCLNKAFGHQQAAATLNEAHDYPHALFMALTGYEEMAKCSRVLDAAHFASRMGAKNIVVEEAVFSEHESKYKITMSYLDGWLPELDGVRRTFMPGIRSVDPPRQKATRRKLFQRGLKIRNACLYVDHRKRWVGAPKVSKNEVARNIVMLNSMMSGFHTSLTNWAFAMS